jgi:hypothetical protein
MLWLLQKDYARTGPGNFGRFHAAARVTEPSSQTRPPPRVHPLFRPVLSGPNLKTVPGTFSCLGCPCRIDFSRADATLMASSGNATSISFLGRMRDEG